MITRLALYSVLGLLLNAMGSTWDTWQFWCMVGLFWAAERLSYQDTLDMIQEEVDRIREERKEKP